MDTPTAAFLACFAAYLIGAIPFGYLIAKHLGGQDIREHGSGNIGATNVARVMGWGWGLGVLLLDCLKGMLPVLWLPALMLGKGHPALAHVQVGCGVAAIVGHMFPCWLRFRGGKGVATALGVVLVLAHWATLAATAAFGLSFLTWRIVSLSSMLAVATFAVVQFILTWPDLPQSWSDAAFSVLVPVLIIYRHRSNLSRLLRGEERAFRAGRSNRPPAEDHSSDDDDNV